MCDPSASRRSPRRLLASSAEVLWRGAEAAGVADAMIEALLGLDHGVGHFRPFSLTRQRRLLAYHDIAISHEGLCQVF